MRRGRRPVVLASLVVTLVLGYFTAASTTLAAFIILKFGLSTTVAGVYFGSFVILMEVSSTRSRSAFGVLHALPWAVGYMLLPAITYLIREWRWLQVALVTPLTILLLSFWWLPESPRWLILHGRYDDALDVLTRAATVNKTTLPPRADLLIACRRIMEGRTCGEGQSKRSIVSQLAGAMEKFFFLLKIKELRKTMYIILVCWIISSVVYYGVSLSATNLSANPYLYIFLGGLLEIPSYLMLWMSLIHLGRRSTLIALYLVCVVCISSNTILMFCFPQVPTAAKIILSQCGKMGIAAAFQLLYLYTAELFPTKYRSLAIGECSMLARLGSITSPYINDMLGDTVAWAPSALFAGGCLVAIFHTLFLPETKDQVLPDHVNITRSKKPVRKNTAPLMKPQTIQGMESSSS